MSVANVFGQLMKEISALPAETNPYLYLADSIHARVYFRLGKAGFGMIYCGNILLFISIICYASAMWIRSRTAAGFWLYKLVDSPGGKLITPHTTNCFSMISIVYALSSIIGDTLMVLCFHKIGRGDSYMWFYPIRWSCTLLAIVSELHGVAIFLISVSGPRAQELLDRIPRSAVFINAGFLALYLIVCLTTSVPYALQSYWLSRGVHDVDGLVGVVNTIANEWQPGEKLVLNPQMLPWLQKLNSMTNFTKAAITAFGCHLAMILVVTLLFLPICAIYAFTLRRQLQGLKILSNTLTTESSKERQLRRSYRTIAIEMVLVLLCAVAYSVILALWKSDYDAIIIDSSRISILLPTWFSVYPFPSFFISITLLYRALSANGSLDQGKAGHLVKTSNGSNSSRSFGAQVAADLQMINLTTANKEKSIAEDLRKEGLY